MKVARDPRFGEVICQITTMNQYQVGSTPGAKTALLNVSISKRWYVTYIREEIRFPLPNYQNISHIEKFFDIFIRILIQIESKTASVASWRLAC